MYDDLFDICLEKVVMEAYEEIRDEKISISERQLMYAIGGQLFDQAPNRQPRKAEIIMAKVRDKFREEAYNMNEYYSLSISKNKLKEWIHNLLISIPEFEELNLTQIEYEKGIKVDDENRPKYSFTSAYDVETKDSWKNDFIDLDAFTRNVYINLVHSNDTAECFLCGRKDTEFCKTCKHNERFTSNYKCDNAPNEKRQIVCDNTCYRGYCICCEICKDKDTCENKCMSNSKNCGKSRKYSNTTLK